MSQLGLLCSACFPGTVMTHNSITTATNFMYREFLSASTVAMCGEADCSGSHLRCVITSLP